MGVYTGPLLVDWAKPFQGRKWRTLRIDFNRELGILWYYMQPGKHACYTLGMLREIFDFQQAVLSSFEQTSGNCPIRYLVLASDAPGVFNLGGDLDLFQRLIAQKDLEGLRNYAKACIDVLYQNAISLELPVTTISLVQGKALGGGFEAALSSNIVIAESTSQMGFPEILFNLFPGMGAYHLLCRRVAPVQAQRMIEVGRTFDTSELKELSLIDIVAAPGEGEEAVYDYIKKQNRSWNGHIAIQRVCNNFEFFSYDALAEAAEIWVEAALNLSDKDIRKMQKLVKAQQRLMGFYNDEMSGIPTSINMV